MMLRRFLPFLALVLACTTGTALAAYKISSQLEQFSQWLLSRIKPDLEVLIGSIDMRSMNQFVVSDLYLRPRVGTSSESVWVERLTLEVEWAPPVSIRVKSLKADQPVLRIGNRLLDILMGEQTSGSSQRSKDSAPLPALEIRKGDARLRIAELPPTDFKFSAATTAAGDVQVTLENIRSGRVAANSEPADAEMPDGVTVTSLTAMLPRDLLGSRTISGMSVSSPSIRFTPGAMDAWRIVANLPDAGGASAPAGGGTDAPIAMPSALTGWSIASLDVTGGLLELSGYPPEMPCVAMDFSGTLSGVGLGDALLGNDHALTATNLRVATSFAPSQPFLVVPEATLAFRVGDLLERRITSLDVTNASLTLDRAFRSMASLRELHATSHNSVQGTQADAQPFWLVERLGFQNTRVTLADLGAGIPDIAFRLPAPSLLNVALTGDTRSASQSVERVEIADIVLHSPLDPFTPVVTLPTVFVEFSLAGLLRREIDSLHVLNPTIYVSKDLFWFIENSRMPPAAAEPAPDSNGTEQAAPATLPDWKLGNFQLSHGKLAIALQGANKLALPIPFATRASNISFANLSDLRLDLDIEVPAEDYRFPSYQLELLTLSGQLTFGLPPGSEANNLVNTLTSKSVVWRQFRSGDAWVSVTYDVEGIYGKFGAAIYDGYLDGGFSFFLNQESSWTGWAAGTGIDLAQFTSVATPGNLSLDGPAEFEVQVNAEGPKIQRVMGNFSTTRPGTLGLPKLEALLERLPAEWSSLKQDIARIGIDALREFRYASGKAEFWFIDKHGRINMALTGPEGSRTFDVVIHDTPFTTPKLWERSLDLTTSMYLGQSTP